MSNLSESLAALHRQLQMRMDATRTPAVALALFDRERCVHVANLGLADPEAGLAVQPDTLFGIGSITKCFTAVAVMQAVEQGLIDLHTPITEYLPWFQVQSEFAPMTVHHLLCHSAGLVGIIDRSPDPRGAVWALRETEAAWPPGAHFCYSDAGYQVLALAVEGVLGEPFRDIVRSRIFAPLGMAESEAALTHAIRPRMAKGYAYLYDDRPPHRSHPLVPAPWIETTAGDCAIAATAEDMARFGRMLLNRGRGPDGAVLSPETYELIVHPHMTFDWASYGYGFEVHQRDGFTHIGHGGGMPGYLSFLLLDTDNGLGMTILSTQPPLLVRDLAWRVLGFWRDVSLGRPAADLDLSAPDPLRVVEAADFAGTYRGANGSLELAAEGDRLLLHHRDEQIALEKRGENSFYANHADFDRFLLRFGRGGAAEEAQGEEAKREVKEAWYGSEWYVNERYAGPQQFDCPSEWTAYPGHYRAQIPWESNNFRVLLRKGRLWLVWPAGEEEPLTPLAEGVFRVGDGTSPERLRFGQVANGQALCANLSGSDYYRFFVA